jgi:uncharacterized DUF497 family protein
MSAPGLFFAPVQLDAKAVIHQNGLALKIEGLIWLDEIVEKLGRKHRVEVYEVEELFEGNPKFRFVEPGNLEGEDVYSALGRSEAGRYLIAFFIRKADNRALPISARDMTSAERQRYARK